MKAIVERHGGAVEKFIGDAVMAVFGVPTANEDDALRAVRAAAEMRDALPELGLQARIGVNTGMVVTGTEERLATGDVVNVAARLEQAAEPGDVLLGEPTLALVRETVEIEPLEPLELKGKAEPVPAHRLLVVLGEPERRHETRFVGRERELALIREAWERALSERRCELVTVVGDAGVGKSRLVAEALAPLDAAIVRGRCLPYGEGITCWPVVEVLKQLDTLPPDAETASAIRSLLGEADATAAAEELAWAFRKTLEHPGAQRPLAVIFDDVHAGEETFLDLVEHVALLSSGSPILLICMSRPELIERRAEWPVQLRLEPLPAEDVDSLIPARIGKGLREQIARAAGGNPLFVGEMLVMADDGDGSGEMVVPPTLQALLAARLDQLAPAERTVLECGAVEGEVFHRGAVQTLATGEGAVTPRLAAVSRLDFDSAARLLERAAALAPGSEVDLALETDLIDALTGTEIENALARARAVSERSAAADDRVGQLCGRIHEAVLRVSVEPAGAADALETARPRGAAGVRGRRRRARAPHRLPGARQRGQHAGAHGPDGGRVPAGSGLRCTRRRNGAHRLPGPCALPRLDSAHRAARLA